MATRYVSTGADGWLNVKLEPSAAIVSLPQYIRANFIERRNGRDYFRIEEGVYRDKDASVSQKSPATSWLAEPLPTYRGAVILTFIKGEGKLVTPIGTITAITDTNNPIANGNHPVQLPDFPHDLGNIYVPQASKAMTWFYLGTGNAVPGSNDRYLHPGKVSGGCVTITDISKWDSLYDVLILSRAPGGRNVGNIAVQD